MNVLLFSACLIQRDVYEERLVLLSDDDGDGFTPADGDCNDSNAAIHPDAVEDCNNNLDDDCNGEVDDGGEERLWYPDGDGDGYGAGDPFLTCGQPAGTVDNNTDCDDTDAAVNPGAEEVPYDEVDNDCDGSDADDLDGDGYASTAVGGSDCDDDDAEVYPGAEETWANGYVDNDCDQTIEFATVNFGSEAIVGEEAGGEAGRRFADVGDLDGDGGNELLVAASFDSQTYEFGGTVFLLSGQTSGELEDFPKLLAPGEYTFLGSDLSAGLDVDGDGVSDLIVSGSGYNDGQGAAWVVSGATLKSSSEMSVNSDYLVKITGTHSDAYAGSQTQFVGDIDGDGLEDFLISAPFYSETYDRGGAVGVFSDLRGLESVTIEDGDGLIEGYYDENVIGSDIEGAGDVNGDGYDDYMVSSGSGDMAYILPGGDLSPDLLSDAIFRLTRDEGEDIEKVNPRMLGDIDGDGEVDFGAVLEKDVLLIYTNIASSSLQTENTYSLSFRPDESEDSYFTDVVSIGDRNRDGADDLLIPVTFQASAKTSTVGLFSSGQFSAGVELTMDDADLVAYCERSRVGFLGEPVGDFDQDGDEDIALGGIYDSTLGKDAGSVVFLSLPEAVD